MRKLILPGVGLLSTAVLAAELTPAWVSAYNGPGGSASESGRAVGEQGRRQ